MCRDIPKCMFEFLKIVVEFQDWNLISQLFSPIDIEIQLNPHWDLEQNSPCVLGNMLSNT